MIKVCCFEILEYMNTERLLLMNDVDWALWLKIEEGDSLELKFCSWCGSKLPWEIIA